jgi:hypothetical protein
MLAIDHSAMPLLQPNLQNQSFHMDAVDLCTLGPQTIGSANFINFPIVSHNTVVNATQNDKRTLGVCAFLYFI